MQGRASAHCRATAPTWEDWSGGRMNKADMIEQIAQAAEISKSAAERAVDAMVAAVKTSLRKGEPVTLVGFGSFYVVRRSARAGRNPRTGAEIAIRAARAPKFRPGKALKDALN